jgi:hypothetical protein
MANANRGEVWQADRWEGGPSPFCVSRELSKTRGSIAGSSTAYNLNGSPELYHSLKAKRAIGVVLLVGLVVHAGVAVCTTGCHGNAGHAQAACIASPSVIENVKEMWRREFKKREGDIPTDADLFGPDKYLFQKPACPSHGIYTLGPTGEAPTCSIPGHSIRE